MKSRIPGVEWVINPYLGCAHGCRYCYAVFMRKFSKRHQETPWGDFVEAKVNIAEVLRAELRRKRKVGRALLSSVCDAYQPAERHYGLTRQCIEALLEAGWQADILTRSPLVVRDIDLLASTPGNSVGISIPTDDDSVRQVLEPRSPTIGRRIQALKQVHEAGIHTWVFIAPVLPQNPARLYELVRPHLDEVLWDSLNYPSQVRSLFEQIGWRDALTRQFARQKASELEHLFKGIPHRA